MMRSLPLALLLTACTDADNQAWCDRARNSGFGTIMAGLILIGIVVALWALGWLARSDRHGRHADRIIAAHDARGDR